MTCRAPAPACISACGKPSIISFVHHHARWLGLIGLFFWTIFCTCAGGWHNYLRHHRQGQHGACVHNVRRHRDERNLRTVGTQAREGRGCSRGLLLWRLPHHRCVRPPHREHHWESTVRHRTWMPALLQYMRTHRAMCANYHILTPPLGMFALMHTISHTRVHTLSHLFTPSNIHIHMMTKVVNSLTHAQSTTPFTFTLSRKL